MHNSSTQGIIILIAGSSLLLLLFISFIVSVVYKYQQKQNLYNKEIEVLKKSHENTLLQSQLEMQEQTFQNISREIHDNISQKLTLVKLYLNTIDIERKPVATQQIGDSVKIISQTINDLSDLSRSMSSEVVLNNGLIKALEYEVAQLSKTGLYNISISVSGNPVFMKADTELVLFRIVQEVLNNIIKHASASVISIKLHYEEYMLILCVNDNGKGFDTQKVRSGLGLQNIKKRAVLLHGNLFVNSIKDNGTEIKIEIPFHTIAQNS